MAVITPNKVQSPHTWWCNGPVMSSIQCLKPYTTHPLYFGFSVYSAQQLRVVIPFNFALQSLLLGCLIPIYIFVMLKPNLEYPCLIKRWYIMTEFHSLKTRFIYYATIHTHAWASVCLTTNVSTSSIYLIINVRGDVGFTIAVQCIITIMWYNCRHDASVLARGAQCPLRCNNILTGQVQVPSNIPQLLLFYVLSSFSYI